MPTQTTDAGFQRQLRCVSMRRHAALRLPAPAAGAESCRRDAEGVQVAINHLHVGERALGPGRRHKGEPVRTRLYQGAAQARLPLLPTSIRASKSAPMRQQHCRTHGPAQVSCLSHAASCASRLARSL